MDNICIPAIRRGSDYTSSEICEFAVRLKSDLGITTRPVNASGGPLDVGFGPGGPTDPDEIRHAFSKASVIDEWVFDQQHNEGAQPQTDYSEVPHD